MEMKIVHNKTVWEWKEYGRLEEPQQVESADISDSVTSALAYIYQYVFNHPIKVQIIPLR